MSSNTFNKVRKVPEATLCKAAEDKEKLVRRIIGSVIYLAQISRYDILYSSNQPARATSNPSKAHMGAAKHLLRNLTGSIDLNITYRKGGKTLTAFSDYCWGNSPDNGKSTSSYVLMRNGPVSFKVGMQGLTDQSTMEAELVAAALAMKEAVNCAGMMEELGFEETFKCVPVHIDNTSALHVAGNKTYSSRAKHVVLKVFYVHEIIQEGKVSIHYIPTQFNIPDIGTKFLSKDRHRYLIGLINNFKT